MDLERKLTEGCCARFGAPDALEDYLALYDEDALIWGYGPGPLRGKAEIRAFYQGILASFSEIRLVLDEVLEDAGKGALVLRFHMDCRHVGAFMGIPPTGRSASLPGITVLRFAAGRCVERWASADFLGLLVQLGALPAPA